MRMNKVMMAMVLGLGAVSGAQAGQLTINGSISDSACVVDAGDANKIIELGNVNKSNFTDNSKRVGERTFTIGLTGCAASEEVMVRFGGQPMPSATDYLSVTTADDAAAGVGVGFFEQDGTLIPLTADSAVQKADATGKATLNYMAGYVAPDVTKVTAGSANAVGNFTVIHP
ncbi:fimbrial protein [Pseudomonas sp. AU10]|uniref:fimbrial protein n=1 Tax=Pseudomonas sp. AU10 TaxID=882697 RepID=UPI0021E29F84|nr:fimbrial protein [Pseudomonas sp. AU10]MCV2226887.1 type 1 fimbrial protein [Pseudomonas sp. AU10]